MEAHIVEVPVVLLLHLLEEVGGALGLVNGILPAGVEFDLGQFQRPGDVHHRQVIVAAEHIEQDGVSRELQLRLERIVPGEVEALHAFSTVRVPVEPVMDHQRVLRVGRQKLDVLVDLLGRGLRPHRQRSRTVPQLVDLGQ